MFAEHRARGRTTVSAPIQLLAPMETVVLQLVPYRFVELLVAVVDVGDVDPGAGRCRRSLRW